MHIKSIFISILTAIVLTVFTALAYADDDYSVSKTITAENTWTNGIYPALTQHRPGAAEYKIPARSDFGTLNICIWGTWTATVTLQKFPPAAAEWIDTGVIWTQNDCSSRILDTEPGVRYRIGVATGDYTSGTVYVELSY